MHIYTFQLSREIRTKLTKNWVNIPVADRCVVVVAAHLVASTSFNSRRSSSTCRTLLVNFSANFKQILTLLRSPMTVHIVQVSTDRENRNQKTKKNGRKEKTKWNNEFSFQFEQSNLAASEPSGCIKNGITTAGVFVRMVHAALGVMMA